MPSRLISHPQPRMSLGIHPHVIISGIASILPKEGRKESEMNDETKVNIVDPHDSNVSLGVCMVAGDRVK